MTMRLWWSSGVSLQWWNSAGAIKFALHVGHLLLGTKCVDLYLPVCALQSERQRQNEGRPFTATLFWDKHHTQLVWWCCIYTFAEHHFAQAQTEIDKTEREITRVTEGEKEWVHNDRWAWHLLTSIAPAIWQTLQRRAIQKGALYTNIKHMQNKNRSVSKKYCSGTWVHTLTNLCTSSVMRLCVCKGWESDKQNASHWLCSEC